MSIRVAWGMIVLVAIVAFAFWAGKQVGSRAPHA